MVEFLGPTKVAVTEELVSNTMHATPSVRRSHLFFTVNCDNHTILSLPAEPKEWT